VKRSPAVASRAWHAVLAVIVCASLITQIVLTATNGQDVGPGGALRDDPAGTRFIRLFSFFTIQSNLLVLAAAVSLALHPARDGRFWRILRLDALLGIIITGLVYATVLAGTAHPHGAAWWANLGFHYIAPWWALAGWLLFGPRPRIERATIAWAFLWPALWIGYTLAHGAATRWFPYPFTDATQIGYAAAVRNMFFVAVLAAVFAALLRLLDTRLPTHAHPGSPPAESRPSAPSGAAAGSGAGGSAAGGSSRRRVPAGPPLAGITDGGQPDRGATRKDIRPDSDSSDH
jgi:hypothetical protein